MLVELRAIAVRALDELAEGCKTSADVAQRLTDNNCQGASRSSYSCPLAVWVITKLRYAGYNTDHVGVSIYEVCVLWDGGDFAPQIRMPPLVIEFRRDFDDGVFPQLALNPSEFDRD